jgi:hypothetical protein
MLWRKGKIVLDKDDGGKKRILIQAAVAVRLEPRT